MFLMEGIIYRDKNSSHAWHSEYLKGIVHFEIHFWYVLAYLKGIQD